MKNWKIAIVVLGAVMIVGGVLAVAQPWGAGSGRGGAGASSRGTCSHQAVQVQEGLATRARVSGNLAGCDGSAGQAGEQVRAQDCQGECSGACAPKSGQGQQGGYSRGVTPQAGRMCSARTSGI